MNGDIEIFLDDLNEAMDCTVFITAGSYVQFEPANLMDDKEVRVVSF